MIDGKCAERIPVAVDVVRQASAIADSLEKLTSMLGEKLAPVMVSSKPRAT